VPPLRDRPEDLPELARLLLRKHAGLMGRGESPGLAVGALEVLRRYDWPGNIRELENLMMRLVALAPRTEIREDDIPPEYWLPTLNQVADDLLARPVEGKSNLFHLATQQFQRYLIRLMIARSHGNRRLAARALGISYTTLKDKMREAAEGDGEDGQAAIRSGSRSTRPSASWPPDIAGLDSSAGQAGGDGGTTGQDGEISVAGDLHVATDERSAAGTSATVVVGRERRVRTPGDD